MFVLVYRVCTHVRLGILATSICVYVCVGVESMYTCKIGNVWQPATVSMFVLL